MNRSRIAPVFSPLLKFVVFAAASTTLSAHASADALDDAIGAIMAAHKVPGLSAVVVCDGQSIWSGTYGFADIASGTPVTDDTLFLWGSVSKSVAATALMQLQEQGLVGLNDPINQHLPFDVVHPNFPAVPIRVSHVLHHTGGLRDNWGALFATEAFNENSSYDMTAFLQEYFTPGGAFYDPALNFRLNNVPGAAWGYCSPGFALSSVIVEQISGASFDDYVQENIFGPMGLSGMHWRLDGLDLSTVATPYEEEGSALIPLQHSDLAIYPAGFLRATSAQMAQVLTMFMQDGAYDDAQIIAPETLALMHAPAPATQAWGLGFQRWPTLPGHPQLHVGHTGSYLGATSIMIYNTETKVGVVLAMNGPSEYSADALTDLRTLLLNTFDGGCEPASPWSLVGAGTPGIHGVPSLEGTGPLTAGSTMGLDLQGAAGDAMAALFLSVATSNPVPFKGGTLYTFPVGVMFMLVTPPSGDLLITFPWPSDMLGASGIPLYWQYAIQDESVPLYGASLTNAVQCVIP